MIVFENWVIRQENECPVRQFDNGAASLKVVGDLPEGWEWSLLVKNGTCMDILPLERMGDGVGTVLAAEHLALSGFYRLQLKGKRDGVVRHTNTVTFYVESSLSGDVQWPAVPSEFSDMERRISEKAAQVEGYATHPPTVGANGNWWEWDGSAYIDTGKPSRGETGAVGPGYELSEADKAEMVQAVLAALPDGDEVSY